MGAADATEKTAGIEDMMNINIQVKDHLKRKEEAHAIKYKDCELP
jgi:hypothetical protein